MKYVAPVFALALALMAAACGNSNNAPSSTNASGTWSDALTSSTGQQEGTLTFALTQNGTSISGMNMNFSNTPNLSQCFGAGTTMAGQMNMQMGMGGSMTGTMTMTMTGNPNGGSVNNTLVMQGAMGSGMNSSTGTFTLTGNTTGCTSQTGTFTMTRTGT